jgi:hypothetical protein
MVDALTFRFRMNGNGFWHDLVLLVAGDIEVPALTSSVVIFTAPVKPA